MMTRTPSTKEHARPIHTARRGNLLVGCGVVLFIVIILAAIGIFYTATHWRSWTATLSTNAFDSMLSEAQIDPKEHAEIMVHVQDLMTRFENKEVSTEELQQVLKQVTHSPVIPAALVIGIDRLYLTNSDLPDEEKIQARNDLARYTQGLFNHQIPQVSMNEVLAPVTTTTPDSNDIKLNLKIDANGRTVTALRSADEVTSDDLRTLIATAKTYADDAEIDQTPAAVDLSDEIQKAIEIALGEREPDPEPADGSVEGSSPDAGTDKTSSQIEEPPAIDPEP